MDRMIGPLGRGLPASTGSRLAALTGLSAANTLPLYRNEIVGPRYLAHDAKMPSPDERDWRTEYLKAMASRANEKREMEEMIKKREVESKHKIIHSLLPLYEKMWRVERSQVDNKGTGNKGVENSAADSVSLFIEDLRRIFRNLSVEEIRVVVNETVFDPKYHNVLYQKDAATRGQRLVVTDVLSPGFVTAAEKGVSSFVLKPVDVATASV